MIPIVDDPIGSNGDATCIVISVCCISSGSPLDHLQLVDLVFVVPVPDSGAVL